MKNNFSIEVFKKASLCRNFEEEVIINLNNKNISIPTYVSAGQEFISATLSVICKKKKLNLFYLDNIDVIRFTYPLVVIQLN